eukprot:258561_1
MNCVPRDFQYICQVDEMPIGHRRCFVLGPSKRKAVLINHNGILTCIDALCFHFGGPLYTGDIEDIGGSACIRCPWHRYSVELTSGHCRDPMGNSLGDGQRTHRVHVDADSASIYVEENVPVFGTALRSDRYNCKSASQNVPSKPGQRIVESASARRARLSQSLIRFPQRKPNATPKISDTEAKPDTVAKHAAKSDSAMDTSPDTVTRVVQKKMTNFFV